MSDKKDFEEVYSEIINNIEFNEKWQKARDEKKKSNIISLIVCICLDILIIYLLLGNQSIRFFTNFISIQNIFMVVPILILDAIVFATLSFFGKEQKEYYKVFKENIIKKVIENFYDNLEYFPNKEMPERIYKESKYDIGYANYYSDDYMETMIDNKYDMEMAEVVTENTETYTDSEGKEQTRTITLFHGLFAKIVIDKSINCELNIRTNGSYFLNKERLEMDSRRI